MPNQNKQIQNSNVDSLGLETIGNPWKGSFNHPHVLGFSAIYDDRQLWSDGPVVVVLGIMDPTFNPHHLSWTLWYHNNGKEKAEINDVIIYFDILALLPSENLQTMFVLKSYNCICF